MEKFVQRINYACITPFRNYCLLSEKKERFGTSFNLDLDDLDDEIFTHKVTEVNSNKKKTLGRVYSLPKSEFKHKCFFTDNQQYNERFDVFYPGKNIGLKEYFTDKSHQIKRHFANPFSRITVLTYEKSITVIEDKIILKFYRQTKHRDFNSRYFKKDSISTTLSIDLKTGNFTIGKNNGKKGRQIFLKNYFGPVLNDFMYYFFSDPEIDRRLSTNFVEKLNVTYSLSDLINKLNIVLGFDIKALTKKGNSYSESKLKEEFIKNLMDFFIEKRKIKVPDGDVKKYFIDLYPTEKFLKTNDRKLISAVLDMLGFKSKLTIKILHKHPNVDITSLYMLCTILGPNYTKYLGNLHEYCFLPIDEKKTYSSIKYEIMQYRSFFNLTDIERENIISMINSRNRAYFSRENIILLEDHLKMIENIRKYIPDTHFKSRTEEEFRKNHTELSKISSQIKKGWSIEYVFSSRMVDDVEKPITITIDNTSFEPDLTVITPESVSVTFYPYILKREEEYVEEGAFMHHCVATYTKKDKSIIISVRTDDATDRVTCEYNGQDGRLLQARHFCNAKPPADMEMAVDILTEKVKKYAKLGMLHAIEQKKVPVRINGIDITIDTPTNPYVNFIEHYDQPFIFDF